MPNQTRGSLSNRDMDDLSVYMKKTLITNAKGHKRWPAGMTDTTVSDVMHGKAHREGRISTCTPSRVRVYRHNNFGNTRKSPRLPSLGLSPTAPLRPATEPQAEPVVQAEPTATPADTLVRARVETLVPALVETLSKMLVPVLSEQAVHRQRMADLRVDHGVLQRDLKQFTDTLDLILQRVKMLERSYTGITNPKFAASQEPAHNDNEAPTLA